MFSFWPERPFLFGAERPTVPAWPERTVRNGGARNVQGPS